MIGTISNPDPAVSDLGFNWGGNLLSPYEDVERYPGVVEESDPLFITTWGARGSSPTKAVGGVLVGQGLDDSSPLSPQEMQLIEDTAPRAGSRVPGQLPNRADLFLRNLFHFGQSVGDGLDTVADAAVASADGVKDTTLGVAQTVWVGFGDSVKAFDQFVGESIEDTSEFAGRTVGRLFGGTAAGTAKAAGLGDVKDLLIPGALVALAAVGVAVFVFRKT